MKSAIHAKRKTDAIISIRQDNTSQSLTILNMNKAAEKLTGYSAQQVAGKSFNNILSPRVNEILMGYIEFGASGSDFAAVARKIPNFQVLSIKGEIVPVSVKVFNLVGLNGNIQEYEILMRDITLIKKLEELKEIILQSQNQLEEKDPDTGLPSINSVVYALDTSYSFTTQYSSIEVCFALIEITNLGYYGETYGDYIAYEIIGLLGNVVKKCCRTEDVIGYMGEGVIGVVLIDCNLESAKNVINRIKTKVDSAKITLQKGTAISLSLSLAYTEVRKERNMVAMIDACEEGLNRNIERGGEGIVQV